MNYYTCRYCRWFKKGYCLNESAFEGADEFPLYKFTEDGKLSEAITEGFGNNTFSGVEKLLASKVSKKTCKEVVTLLYKELEEMKVNWIEGIDMSVSKALENFDFDHEGVSIADPEEFSCKYFW